MIDAINSFLFSMNPFTRLGILLAVFAIMALAAIKTRVLSRSGALGALAIGLVILWTLQLGGFILILAFFLTANLLSRLAKAQHDESREQKGSTRDIMQVLANGLMASLAGLLYASDNLSWKALVMFGCAVAEATSDTWAGEIGRFSKRSPVSMNSFLPVPKGESGGVTALGLLASFAGSAFIAFLWILLFKPEKAFMGFSIIAIAGFIGCLVDSMLGAFVQGHWRGPDGSLVEHPRLNGKELEKARGISWVDNDMVNLMSNVFSCVLGILVAGLF
ncbi:MAG: DUF92 domain-containing protein [Sphaerochaetaceae bacterium]|nr:DUF92 domain-containing protein [Sphaerochaetaceae bacterium]